MRDDIKPSTFMTKDAMGNAITAVAATGGSTNAVMHLLAIAHEAGLELSISAEVRHRDGLHGGVRKSLLEFPS
jgi:dihydroxyacid dehydratase/phosphogluconate dehydratase